MMRRLVVAVCAVVLSAGCFRATTTITVKQDGSGVIDQEVGMSQQAKAMLSGMAGAEKVEAGGVDVQMFGEEQARKLASSMGVRFVSGEPFTANGTEGYRAHYAFDDIRTVQFKETAPSPMAASGPQAEKPPFAFDFVRTGATSVLTIDMPQRDGGLPAGLPQMPGAAGNDPRENAQALSMMATMMRGLFVDVSLAVDGRVVQSSTPFEGSKLTLFQIDLDQLLASDGALQKLQQMKDPKELAKLPGVRMVTAPVVKVEFGR